MKYRRVFVPGGSFFFTVVTHQRRPLFSSAESVEVLRNAFRVVRSTHPFEVEAMVVLPDHLHTIWTLPPGDGDFSTRWRLIKTWFTKHCDPALRITPDASRLSRQEQALWQHRYWEHALKGENDFIQHVEYIHYNPVKHGLANSAIEWPYSSFYRYVAENIYPADWGRGEMAFEGVGWE